MRISLILILFFSLILFFILSFQKDDYNFKIKSNTNFENAKYINEVEGCGFKKNEKGDRKKSAIILVDKKKDITIKNGFFECTNKSVIFLDRSQNIVISKVTAAKGSDNVIQINNSFSIVRDSQFSSNHGNYCIEGDNGIIILFNNVIKDCLIGMEIEKTDDNDYTIIILLNNEFKKIERNIIRCMDRKNQNSQIYLFIKNNILENAPYFEKKGKCQNVLDIDDGLEKAITSNNFDQIKILVEKKIMGF